MTSPTQPPRNELPHIVADILVQTRPDLEHLAIQLRELSDSFDERSFRLATELIKVEADRDAGWKMARAAAEGHDRCRQFLTDIAAVFGQEVSWDALPRLVSELSGNSNDKRVDTVREELKAGWKSDTATNDPRWRVWALELLHDFDVPFMVTGPDNTFDRRLQAKVREVLRRKTVEALAQRTAAYREAQAALGLREAEIRELQIRLEETTAELERARAAESLGEHTWMWVSTVEAIDDPAEVRAVALGRAKRLTMIDAITIAARTGTALRPVGKAGLYYLLSPQPGPRAAPHEPPVTLEQSHLCLPSPRGAEPASPDVADILGPWEVISVEQAQRERAAAIEQGEVLQRGMQATSGKK